MTTRPTLLAALLATACAAFGPSLAHAQAATPAAAAAPDARYVWDLTPMFANDAAWDAERLAIQAALPSLRELRNGFTRDAASLRQALDTLSSWRQRYSRVAVYASAMASTDNRDARNQERQSLLRSLGGQWGSALSWVDSEIRQLGEAKVNAWLAAEPGLKKHEKRLREVLRQAAHQLTPEAEGALAAFGPVLGAATNSRTLLTTVDTDWPTLVVDGKTEKLNDIGYARLRAHPDRAVRQQVFERFFGTYGRLENTLGSLLGQRVETGVVNARLRGYPSAVAASLAENDIPESVYRTLVAETNKGLPTLHRYLKLRQRLLGLPDLAYHDIYPDLVKSERRYTPEESGDLTVAATAPLGADYQRRLREALGAKTMHVFPAPGKSSGAYQSGVYGLTPLVFLNHQGTFDSLSTFAHEWGHGMHTVLANAAQPFETAGYPLFLAEIASFSNELLLQQHMLAQAKSREERLYLLTEAVERLRSSYFRQTMFAEFELATHDALQRGEPLTGKRMTAMYCGLLRKYHGADQGVMKIDPVVCSEWAFVPHFHRPFYVYQYATSMAGAAYFTEQILQKKPGMPETYLSVLRSGGSVHPVPRLRAAGLDMDSPAPYQALVRHMDRLLDEIEKLLAQKA
ncbi:oligoendopeptidase F family protein [Pelomonas sp. UHG3]|uniref:Oligoendopeptidase F family protein n=1 Tax=Roseateles hydrophilus TaxID=2975054 RepID=A0ACC6C948_9BURK|nr:M3 family oligoendopeptidase [Pelomonas sp. UHG3]MCY4744943.1 oligoendopeptidase F family protein [Pelomonas sp. UHG3]